MVVVIATIQLQPGTRDAFLEVFRGILADVRAEDGCIEYFPTIDTPSGLGIQAPPRDDVVTVVERWASLDALKAHSEAPHMLAYRPKVQDMVVRVTGQVLESAE